MSTSFPEQIPTILKVIETVNPKTILDIGCGNGKYGFLTREYFPDVTIDAVDVFEPYITQCHRQNYGKITIANALDMKVEPYDLYLIIDVIEHWEKEPALALLRKLVEHGKVLISTPRSIGVQGAENGNIWETHVSQWLEYEWDEFTREGIPNEYAFIQLLSKK